MIVFVEEISKYLGNIHFFPRVGGETYNQFGKCFSGASTVSALYKSENRKELLALRYSLKGF